MKRKYMLDNPDFDRRMRRLWKLIDKANKEGKNPYYGMTTTEIMRKIRSE